MAEKMKRKVDLYLKAWNENKDRKPQIMLV